MSQTETALTKPSVMDRYIEMIPKRFLNIEGAKALVALADGLSIDDVDDAEQVEAVSIAHRGISRARIEVEKVRKREKTPFIQAGKMLDKHANELKAILEPRESELKEGLDMVKAEMDRRAQVALDARLAEFAAVESSYQHKDDLVGSMSDEGFAELLDVETAAFEALKAERAAEAERVRLKEEGDRKERERLAAEAQAANDAAADAKRKADEEVKQARAKIAADAKKIADLEAKIAAAEAEAKEKAEAARVAAEEASKPAAPVMEKAKPEWEELPPDDIRAIRPLEVTSPAAPDAGLREADFVPDAPQPTVEDVLFTLLDLAHSICNDYPSSHPYATKARAALNMYAAVKAAGRMPA